jgi:hypothetical protein
MLQQQCRKATESCHLVNHNLYHPLLIMSTPLPAGKHDRIELLEMPQLENK